ncbi:MAG: hypothetical protein JWR10_3475 [Rubritepida sp.]|nr:hypothetical protein [Rubritepida sp.]
MTLPAPLMDALAAVAVFAVAYGLIRLGLLQYGMVAPSDADAVPILHVLALAAGVLLGAMLLAAVPHAEDFRPSRIYASDSPWRMDAGQFLARHALPDGPTLRGAAALLMPGNTSIGAILGQMGAVLALAGAVQALMLWRGWPRVRAAVAVLLLAGWTALILHYAAHLMAWGATQLNFWLFALLLVLWQRFRYRVRRAAH